jgi:uncharacterized protein
MHSDRGPWQGHPVIPGEARGNALVLAEGLSFAMAFDPRSGIIGDVHSGATGRSVAGTILVMPGGRGSSSASTSLAEAIRLGTAPAGIILGEVDEILAVGVIVARRLYDRSCPMVVLTGAELSRIETGMRLVIDAHGLVQPSR